MKTKKIFLRSILAFVLICQCNMMSAQRNFYHRLDVGSSNIYTFAGSNLITGYANYLTGDILFDNSFIYSFYTGNYYGAKIKTKNYALASITAKDLFDDCFAGAKLGYQSDNMGSFNWGVYASAHYKVNQFKMLFPNTDLYIGECVQYLKPGVGLFLTLGSIENKTKVQIEGTIRYDVPIGYKGMFGKKADVLNNGLSSHIAIKLAGYSWFSIGAYADVNYYDLYKNWEDNSKFKIYNVGLTFTITPKRGEGFYD